MLKRRTLFIIGAGASQEVGMPLGATLRKLIVPHIPLPTDPWGNETNGSPEIFSALRQKAYAASDLNRIVDYGNAARKLIAALPLAYSIDNVLDAFKDDPDVTLVGKLAIAHTILEAERESKLFPAELRRDEVNLEHVEHTWLTRLWHLLAEGVSRSNAAKDLFSNVAFINFNYDRCVEQYLRHAFATYYNFDLKAADEIVSHLKILHPYGSLGSLATYPFGSRSADYLDMVKALRTFTEQIEDERALNWMAGELASAEVVVYLGFAFHQQNMNLLRRPSKGHKSGAYATTFGLSSIDRETVRTQIAKRLKMPQTAVRLSENKCVDFFDEFQLTLQQRK